MMAKNNHHATSEDTRIALLEQSIVHINESLRDIKDEIKSINSKMDTRFEALERKMDGRYNSLESRMEKLDSKMDSQNSKIDSHFRWTVLLIFGLYGTVVTTLITAVGKAYHWF